MTNKEKYKQAFSAMHISDEFTLEVKNMATAKNKLRLNRLITSVAACVLIVGSATVAYATDFCGIQRTLQLWIHGDQTEATIQFNENGSYSMEYSDGDGKLIQQGGGGVSVGEDGTEIPRSEEELLEQLMSPEVVYEDDGTVCVYWIDQKIDITDKFKNNVCYVKLVSGDDTLYMTVKYQNGFATSHNKYPNPSEFN